jgi:ankyrin repeat protein
MTISYKDIARAFALIILLLIAIIATGISHAFGNTLLYAVKAGDIDGVQAAIANGADINAVVWGNNALIAASYQGNVEIVNILLQKGADVNAKGRADRTALMVAVEKKHIDIVKLLVNKGAEVNDKDFNQMTPLMMASSADAFEIVEILFKHGADINIADNRKKTALSWALRSNAPQAARFLFSSGATISEAEAGEIAIYMAEKRQWDIVKILIEKNIIKSNTKTRRGQTFMMLASEQGQIEIIEFLLENNADVSEKALSLALEQKHCDVAKFLVEKSAEITGENKNDSKALIEASASGCIGIVKYLIDRGADVNRVYTDNRHEFTPLLISVINSHADIVKLLLAHGADTEIEGNPNYSNYYTNSDIGTALTFAIKKNQPVIVKLLLENGANVKSKMKSKAVLRAGKSVLFLAIKTGNIDIASDLLEYGADIGEKIDNESIILFALEEKRSEIAKLLIAKGACEHLSDKDKSKLLITALEIGYFDLAKMFILQGADVNAKQYRYKSKKTALIIASEENHNPNAYEIVQLLTEKGADINAKDKDGNTALHYARDSQIVGYLLTHSENVTESQFVSKFDYLDSDTIKLLLEKYDYADAADKDGETPLIKAVSNSKNGMEITKLLLEYGADPNKQSNTGVTAMMRAAYNAYPKIMKVLWEHGADPSIKDHQGKTVKKYNYHHKFEVDYLLEWMQTKKKDPVESLFVGIEYSDIELVKKAVKNGADTNSREQNGRSRFLGFTPFHLAVYYGYTDIIKFLVEQGGADVNSRSPEGSSLVIAVRYRHQDVVKYLIKQGANVRPQFGTSPITVAEETKNSEMIALLQAAGARSSRTLWKAVIENDYKTVKEELEKGANLNEPFPGYGDCSSLAVAVRLNFPDIAELLIKYKADVNARTAEKMFYQQRGTILHGAVYKENENIVKLLIENGANIEAKLDKGMFEGYTPIKIAEELNNVRLIRLLEKSGAKTSRQKEEMKKALFQAVLSGDFDKVKSLLNDGVDVNTQINKTDKNELQQVVLKDKDQYSEGLVWLLENFKPPETTALIFAISQGYGEIVHLLLDKGADVNTKIIDKESKYTVTPLLLAVYLDKAEIVKMLLEYGADIHARVENRDLGGKTALRIAVKKENLEIIQLLLQAGSIY